MIYDKDIREPLFDFLEEQYKKVRILEEKTIGKSRADLLLVTEEALVGLEIKSDADTYARLQGQVRDYDRYFDRNIIAVGSHHENHIAEHVPPYWGILSVTKENGKIIFQMKREPAQNPKMKWKKKLEILWRPELVLLQQKNGMPKYKEKSKDFVRLKVVEWLESGKIPEEKLRKDLSDILLERDYTAILQSIQEYRNEEAAKKGMRPKQKRVKKYAKRKSVRSVSKL